jgi:hypothetical protein
LVIHAVLFSGSELNEKGDLLMTISERRIQELALEYLENNKREIEEQIAGLRRRAGKAAKQSGRPADAANQTKTVALIKPGRKRRRKMTPEQKKAISEKLKRR